MQLNPGGRVLVWSDLFDSYHNALAGPYYLVNGNLERPWEELPSPHLSRKCDPNRCFSVPVLPPCLGVTVV